MEIFIGLNYLGRGTTCRLIWAQWWSSEFRTISWKTLYQGIDDFLRTSFQSSVKFIKMLGKNLSFNACWLLIDSRVEEFCLLRYNLPSPVKVNRRFEETNQLPCSSTLKMEVKCSPGMSVDFHRTTLGRRLTTDFSSDWQAVCRPYIY
jgi:hypothetical protein